ncbi:MAG: NAD(P)H-binding protein [Solirubrobacteraceae bacterium]
MKTLVTGITGSVGGALAPALLDAGHEVRGFTRDATRVRAAVDDIVEGDALRGTGLDAALYGVDVAYYLIHSMEAGASNGFDSAERRSAEQFAAAAAAAGVRRIVYLGGPVPGAEHAVSRHLGSRLAVEETLLAAIEGSIAFRASLVIAAASRSFRFLVRLVERLPVMALPAWRDNRSMPIDGRDVTRYLLRAATAPEALSGRAWDIVGPEALTHGEMILRIADHLLLGRPHVNLGFSLTPLAAPVAAALAGEDVGLIEPLMESLQSDLLPRDELAAGAFGVHLHSFDAAVERALRELERHEEVRAR